MENVKLLWMTEHQWAEPGTLVLEVGSYSAREIIQRLIHCTQALSAAYKIPESTKSS